MHAGDLLLVLTWQHDRSPDGKVMIRLVKTLSELASGCIDLDPSLNAEAVSWSPYQAVQLLQTLTRENTSF